VSAKQRVIRIAGHGSVAGGTYREVHVSGSGRITSAVECDVLRVSGTVICEGTVKARDIRVSGAADFLADVSVGSVAVSGTSSFAARVDVEKLKVAGTANVGGKLGGGWVDVTGALIVGGDCEVEHFKTTGGFNIAGLLSADTIDVRMHGACKAREVGGESIEFRDRRGPLIEIAAALGLLGKEGLEAESVEGDHVLIERGRVRTVRGRDIELGDGCEVALVEYAAELKQARGARVKTVRKIEPAEEAPKAEGGDGE
jgi:cytoskeletal protein CcmA (bactofilin family)